jgi:uncharacterized protein
VDEIRFSFSNALKPLLKKAGPEPVRYPLTRRAAIKDIIEALGVPHTEVGAIHVGSQDVGFDFIPHDGHFLSVQAVSPPLDVTRPSRVRPRPLPNMRFVVDVNVGKLALLLRILGLDTAYHPALSDGDIAGLATMEKRIVLTRDAGLLKRRQVDFGRLVRARLPDEQLREVVAFFGIGPPYALFSRCLRCNRTLAIVEKKDILHRLEPKTRKYFHKFKQCPACHRIFWRGSHHDEMLARLQRAGVPGLT